MKLIATKSYRYDTRRLVAGDEFEATDMHARILVGARKARYAPDQTPEVPPQRMDSTTQVTAIQVAVGAGVMTPNEGRAKLDLKPIEGGESEATVVEPNDIDSLRAQAERLGIAVDGRWGMVRLQHEIMQARR